MPDAASFRGRIGALSAALLLMSANPAPAQKWQTLSVSRQLSDETSLAVTLRHSAGTLSVRPSDGRLLYAMDLRYDESVFDAVSEFDGRTLELGVTGRNREIRIKKGGSAAEMDVRLSREIPLDLTMQFGAGRAEVDLGGLRLAKLEIATGASETVIDVSRPNPIVLDEAEVVVGAASFTARRLANLNARHITVNAGVGAVVLDLSGAWRRDAGIEIQMGLGSLELRVPRGLGVQLMKQSFLTSLDAPDLTRRDDAWYSADWSSAERRITIDVDAAFGSVKIVWLN